MRVSRPWNGSRAQGLGRRLGQALTPLTARYGIIIIDTPPMLGTLLINALAAADAIIAPVQTDPLALHGLEGLMRTVEMMRNARASVPEPIILPSLMDRRVRARDAGDHARALG